MREIKFRAFEQTEKRMLHNVFFCPNEGHKTFSIYSDEWNCDRKIGKDIFLMQFTGYDIKEVDLFEGDIVYIAGTGKCKVTFDFGGWHFENDNEMISFSEQSWQDVEKIIGNIHQNPELIIR